MASRTKQSPVERLADLEAAVDVAEARLVEVQGERSQAEQRLRAAISNLLAIEERGGAGEDVDAEITEAEAVLAQARQVADVRENDRGENQAELGVWGARLRGAERAIEAAKLERDEFGRRHFADIAVEEIPLDEPAREALVAAWEALQEASNGYAIRVRRWHRLARYGGLDTAEIPLAPLAGDVGEVAARFEAGLPTPTPRVLR
jgi:hypothetical protein